MKRSRLIPSACVLFVASTASAQCVGMPAGSRQWIELQGNFANPILCPGGGVNCGEAVTGVGSIPNPSPNYVLPCFTVGTVFALADSTANRLRSGVWADRANGQFLFNSMVDTYTITGPPGTEGQPAVFTVRSHVTGNLSVGHNTVGDIFVGSANIRLHIGNWNPSTAPTFDEFGRVVAFNPAGIIIRQIPNANYGATQPTQSVDYNQTAMITRTVGQPFDIAFCLLFQGFNGILGWPVGGTPPQGEQMCNATVEFDLPVGFTITSLRGWTDPNAPPPCQGDADGNGKVNFADITEVLTFFNGTGPEGDANHDGVVNFADITEVLTFWLSPCA